MKYYIEYAKIIKEVYEVEAKMAEEAEMAVRKNHHWNSPNIVNREVTESFKNVD